MKMSLKTKLFGAFFVLILFSVVLSLILNSTLLEKYYYKEKEDIMLQSFETIQKAYKNDADNIMLDIEKIESLRGIIILFFDKDFNIIYQSTHRKMYFKKNQPMDPKAPKEPFLEGQTLSEKFKKIQKGKPVIEMRYDKRMEANFVSLYGQIDENVYLYLGTPVEAIKESSKIAV